jgi:phosphoglycolate phosphatase-like HAD superfamily hydrolase
MGLGVPQITFEELAHLRRLEPLEVLRELDVPLWKVPRIMTAVRREMRAHMHALEPFGGIPEVIRGLGQAEVRTAIVTSNARENVRAFLSRHQLTGFETLSCGASLFGKASRIRGVLEQLAVSHESAFYVGDEPRDIVAARKVGVRTVAVTWGYGAREALAAQEPDILVDTPDELLTSILTKV